LRKKELSEKELSETQQKAGDQTTAALGFDTQWKFRAKAEVAASSEPAHVFDVIIDEKVDDPETLNSAEMLDIKTTALKVNVEPHVLRYWEEELGLKIPRNEKGYRYYAKIHIEFFQQVKELKGQGYKLLEIKHIQEKELAILNSLNFIGDSIDVSYSKNWAGGDVYQRSTKINPDSDDLKNCLEQIAATRVSRQTVSDWLKDMSSKELELITEILKEYLE